MQQQIVEYIQSALWVIVTTILGVAAKELILYLREHKKGKFAAIAVKDVEETFTELDGPDKFAHAFASFIDECTHAKIKVNEAQARKLIQSAVNDLRGKTKLALAEPLQSPETLKEAVQEVIKESEKTLSEMTKTDLMNIFSETLQQHAQQNTAPQPAQTPQDTSKEGPTV